MRMSNSDYGRLWAEILRKGGDAHPCIAPAWLSDKTGFPSPSMLNVQCMVEIVDQVQRVFQPHRQA